MNPVFPASVIVDVSPPALRVIEMSAAPGLPHKSKLTVDGEVIVVPDGRDRVGELSAGRLIAAAAPLHWRV